MKLIGIDLASKSKNPTGLAFLEDYTVKLTLAYADDEIVSKTVETKPSIIAIDAPLGLPKTGTMREADRELLKMGLRVFWLIQRTPLLWLAQLLGSLRIKS